MKSLIIGLKSLFYQSNLNHENMQGTGFAKLVDDACKLEGIELTEEELFEETAYFHTHPYLGNFIVGMWVDEYQRNGNPDFYKKVYASAFGALGDSFFWHSLRPLAFILAALVGYHNPVIGLILYMLFFNLFHLTFRLTGYSIGRALGKDVITFFNRINFNRWPTYFDGASALLLGILLSFLVKESFGFNPLILGVLTVYLLVGLTLAKRIDIVYGLVAILFITGFFLFFTGV